MDGSAIAHVEVGSVQQSALQRSVLVLTGAAQGPFHRFPSRLIGLEVPLTHKHS